MSRVPYSEPDERPDWVPTSHARMTCSSCGEWVYTVRFKGKGPAFFPRKCAICEAEVTVDADE